MAGEEKQAAAQQTFVFLGSLTNEPPASAGSGARKRGDREYEIIKKQKQRKMKKILHIIMRIIL